MGTHPIFESDFDCLTEWSPRITGVAIQPQESIDEIKSKSTQSQLADDVAAVDVDDNENAEDVEEEEAEEVEEEAEEEVEEDDEAENDDVVNEQTNEQGTDPTTIVNVKLTQLPFARIKKMIKGADPEWKGGSADAQLMIVYAAERFLAQLADRVWEQKVRQTGRKTMKLSDVTAYVDSESKYEYLEGALVGKTGCLHGLTK